MIIAVCGTPGSYKTCYAIEFHRSCAEKGTCRVYQHRGC